MPTATRRSRHARRQAVLAGPAGRTDVIGRRAPPASTVSDPQRPFLSPSGTLTAVNPIDHAIRSATCSGRLLCVSSAGPYIVDHATDGDETCGRQPARPATRLRPTSEHRARRRAQDAIASRPSRSASATPRAVRVDRGHGARRRRRGRPRPERGLLRLRRGRRRARDRQDHRGLGPVRALQQPRRRLRRSDRRGLPGQGQRLRQRRARARASARGTLRRAPARRLRAPVCNAPGGCRRRRHRDLQRHRRRLRRPRSTRAARAAACVPAAENCNSMDDDCDGKIDEGITPRSAAPAPCLGARPARPARSAHAPRRRRRPRSATASTTTATA